jgi:hypothetical protein
MKCPHCQSKAIIRSSESVSELTRKNYYQCKNVLCGHTFIAHLSITGTICPSACPNPSIRIPLTNKGQLLKQLNIDKSVNGD